MAKKQEIAKTGESPKKPLKNSKRPTLKTGEYRCCDKKWFKKGIKNGQKFACKQCKKETGPKNTITWNKKWYGSFECTVKSCMNQWVSSNTWTVDNKIQTTQCRKCKKSTLPYDIVSEFSPIITTRVHIRYYSYEGLVQCINSLLLATTGEKR